MSQQWRPITLLEAAVRGDIPVGLGGGDLRVTAQEMFCNPAGVPDWFLSLGQRAGVQLVGAGSGTLPGCRTLRCGFPVVVSPAAPKRPPATGCQPWRVGPATRKEQDDPTHARDGTH
jgi:hypothetical protein